VPRLLTVPALFATLALAAGCGSADTNAPPSAQVSAPGTTGASRPGLKPAELVLQLSDVGYGYISAASGSKPVSLPDELKMDGQPATKAADRAGFVGGYTRFFVDGAKDVILPVALLYKPGPYATTVISDLTFIHRVARAWHGSPTTLPATAPGTHRHLFSGFTQQDGSTVAAYLYFWQNGAVLNDLVLVGPHASTERLLTLAKKQNQRQTRLGL